MQTKTALSLLWIQEIGQRDKTKMRVRMSQIKARGPAVKPASGKTKRQGQKSEKVAYLARLQTCNYDWLCLLAREKGVSMAKLLNAILHRKPEPDDYYIR